MSDPIKFFPGQKLEWHSTYNHVPVSVVSVLECRRDGAKLSNGWVVDAYGYAEGTPRTRGGQVVEIFPHEEMGDK